MKLHIWLLTQFRPNSGVVLVPKTLIKLKLTTYLILILLRTFQSGLMSIEMGQVKRIEDSHKIQKRIHEPWKSCTFI